MYHHSVVPLLGWIVLKIAPTASCLGLFPLVNTFVHIIMYTYYAAASFGPSVQPYLWWKKYITQMQLAQFALYAAYTIPFFLFQEGYPLKFWSYIGFPQPFIFFYLFYRFYKDSYTAAASKRKQDILDERAQQLLTQEKENKLAQLGNGKSNGNGYVHSNGINSCNDSNNNNKEISNNKKEL